MPPDRIDSYLDQHLALWRTRGRDTLHGGFHERLSAAGTPLATGYKRLLVQCRQIFAHSYAAHRGFSESLPAAQQGFAFLRRHYLDERRGGWYFSVTPEGKPHDRKKDLYGHAFVLLALAEHYRASPDRAVLKLAEDTVDVLERHFAPAVPSGFAEVLQWDWSYEPAPRLQNPHMHLLEGFVALGEISGKARHIDHAKAIVALLRPQLFQPGLGPLAEYFDAAWRPEAARGHIAEPGHCFEWSWLLRQYHQLAPDADALALGASLYGWGTQFGFDKDGADGIFDAVSRDGKSVIKDSKRIWPLCECIKASAVELEAAPTPEKSARLRLLLDLLFERYLNRDGTWIEHCDRDWRPLVTELPGSTSYHILLALMEARRVLAKDTSPKPRSR